MVGTETQFGADSYAQIEALNKALEVGYGTSPETQTGFGATRIESLEKTLKWVTTTEKSVKFIKELPRDKASSTVEEFSTIQKTGYASFYTEGGLPSEYDEELTRGYELVKYIGAVGVVPNVATEVKAIAGAIETVTKAKTIAILKTANMKAIYGDAAKISTEFNGYYTQFLAKVKRPNENIIDLRGKTLNFETLNDVGRIIEDNYGDPSNIKGFLSNTAYKNYVDTLLDEKRFVLGQAVTDVKASANKFKLANSEGELKTDIFFKYKGQTHLEDPHPLMNSNKSAFAATHADAPNTLSAGTCSATPTELIGTQLAPEVYDYAVVPVNKYGAGAAYEVTSVTVLADQKVVFTIADNGSATGKTATAFEIYRKLSSDTSKESYKFLKTVTAAGTKEDTGSELPGTDNAFFWDWDFDQVLTFKQLLPMVKMPLATISDSVRWLQKWYCVPILFNANKMVVVKNIGTTSW